MQSDDTADQTHGGNKDVPDLTSGVGVLFSFMVGRMARMGR